jgi:hypothetical protein
LGGASLTRGNARLGRGTRSAGAAVKRGSFHRLAESWFRCGLAGRKNGITLDAGLASDSAGRI